LNNNVKTYGALVLSMIFWAFSFIWFKEANKTFTPLTIVFIRLVFSVIMLTTYLISTKRFIRVRKEDRRMFFMLALFEPFVYFLGESFGLTYVSATVCSVIISTIPVVATIASWIFFGERLHKINYAGIILSFIGVLVFIFNIDGSLSFNIRGLALLGIAVVAAVGYNLTLSKLVGSYSPVHIVNTQNLLGSLLFMPLFIFLDFRGFMNTRFTFEMFKPIIELSVFASCGAFIFFAFAVGNIGITKANVFSNCIPVFTAVFSFFLLGDKLTFQNMTGMVIVVSGLFLSQINGSKRAMNEAVALSGHTA
jgi:drug/metabolite transporter (DMT)-like permease